MTLCCYIIRLSNLSYVGSPLGLLLTHDIKIFIFFNNDF